MSVIACQQKLGRNEVTQNPSQLRRKPAAEYSQQHRISYGDNFYWTTYDGGANFSGGTIFKCVA